MARSAGDARAYAIALDFLLLLALLDARALLREPAHAVALVLLAFELVGRRSLHQACTPPPLPRSSIAGAPGRVSPRVPHGSSAV